MAITRTQQARQMYKKGSKKPVKQAGVMNYMPSEMVTVPKIAKSSPDTPTAKLAYITPEEQDILIDLNLYGSLDGKPNRGPGGIPSLEGDFGGGDTYSGGAGDEKVGGGGGGNQNTGNAREDYITNYVSKQKVKGGGAPIKDSKGNTIGYEDKKVTGDDVRDARRRYEKQFFDQGKVPPLGSRPTSFKTKLNQRNLQKRLNYINYVQQQIRDKINKGLIDYQEEEGPIEGLTDFDTLESYIDKVQSVQDLVDKGFYKSDGQFAKGEKIPDFPSTDFPGSLQIINEIFGGPVTSDKLKQLNEQFKTLEGLKTTEGLESTTFKDLMKEYQPNRYEQMYGDPKDDRGPSDPCKGPNPPAYCFIGGGAETPPEDPVFTPSFRFMNRGGMVEDAPMGGIMDLESTRQMLFLGGIAKGIKKGLKSVTRGLKKVAKSPLGKAAILGTIGYGLGGGTFFGKTLPGVGTSGGFSFKNILPNILGAKGDNEFDGFPGIFGLDGKISKGLGVFGLSGLAGALLANVGKDKDDGFNIEEYYKMAGIDIPENQYRFLAEGGSTEKEPVAKKTMPLLDLEGQEMDFRQDGGFVPIGRMEKADDVPARLSKNEFVFTAEAVRNAGGGDVDKGAEVMYNTMKNLEAGGEVSEETQGLEGARKMFQTSQRLGEVV